MTRMYQTSFCLGIIIVLAVTPAVHAELPPQAYEQYQKEAPEAVTISVQSVKRTETEEKEFTLIVITAKARIDNVVRSATGLKPGDVIRIAYQHRRDKEPVPGPSQPEIISEGKSYPAFLAKQKDGSYSIAARGYSFRLVK